MRQTLEAPVQRPARVRIPPPSYEEPYLGALAAGAAVFALYAITLAPTTAFWDTSEYIATAHILGIPHPPGNPLFVVFARAWELLLAPTGLSVAVRVNLFSAAMSAAAHGFWFLVAHRILAFYSESRLFRLVGASLAVLISATAFTVWNHSNVNEKVYTVSLFTIALLSWLAFHWRDHLGEGKDDNLLLLMAYLLALSVGNHLMAFLAAPALLVFVLLVEPRTLANWKLYVGIAVVVLIGLSVHLYLPLRASLQPVINEADPSTWEALWASLTRQQYDKPSMFMNPIDPRLPRDIGLLAAQIGNYVQYFDWQWARSVAGNVAVFGGARPFVTLLFLLLGVAGAVSHYRRDRTSWVYVAVLFATLSLGLVFYLNFKYGYAWAVDSVPNREAHEVRERDYFFIVSFSVWGIWAGIGLAAVWRWLSVRLGGALEGAAATVQNRALIRATPVLALAIVPLVLNWGWASRAGDYSARDWAYNLLMSVEPYGVLFTNGDNDTFPLWYLQEVENIRQDVTVIVGSYLNTPWYAKQLKQLTTPCPAGVDPRDNPTRIVCQRPYDPEQGPDFYREAARRPPTRSILPLSDQEVEEIASTRPFLTQDALVFRAGGIETSLPPGTFMVPSDMFMTAIVTSSIDDRPIYYATTTPAYEKLSLSPYLIRQGVAFKLSTTQPEHDPEAGIVALPPTQYTPIFGEYIDLPRTERLLHEIFVHRGGIPEEWEYWVDASTQGIPTYYGFTHLATAQANAILGNSERAEEHVRRANAWFELSQR